MTADHWLRGVRRLPSPNADARPPGATIDLVVLHNISLPPGRFGGGEVEALFCNELDCSIAPELEDLRSLKVSAHLLVSRRGRITQFVPFDQRAWHAGVSGWDGRPGCNDYAIGIELEGTDERSYTQSQYRQLDRILDTLLRTYPRLSAERIVGHQQIAPGRKTDPGPSFDWARVLNRQLRRAAGRADPV
ncbi:MAG: 1,6-anhydro-N-acetylmuramyl-L-alanine amidase AmpD [Pseudomonadota bacterium]